MRPPAATAVTSPRFDGAGGRRIQRGRWAGEAGGGDEDGESGEIERGAEGDVGPVACDPPPDVHLVSPAATATTSHGSSRGRRVIPFILSTDRALGGGRRRSRRSGRSRGPRCGRPRA